MGLLPLKRWLKEICRPQLREKKASKVNVPDWTFSAPLQKPYLRAQYSTNFFEAGDTFFSCVNFTEFNQVFYFHVLFREYRLWL